MAVRRWLDSPMPHGERSRDVGIDSQLSEMKWMTPMDEILRALLPVNPRASLPRRIVVRFDFEDDSSFRQSFSSAAIAEALAHVEAGPGPTSPAGQPELCSHSEDFRSIRWYGGETFNFTPRQALVVAKLWAAWEKSGFDLDQKILLQAAGVYTTRLSELFRGSPAWGKLIVQGSVRGSYRLAKSPDTGTE